MVVYVECVFYNKPSCSLALCEQLCYQMIQFVVFTTVSGMRELDVDVYSDGKSVFPPTEENKHCETLTSPD